MSLRFYSGSWKNPLLNKLGIGSVPSTKVSVIQEAEFLTSNFTTTTVGSLAEPMHGNIRIPNGQLALFSFASFGAKHSTAGANFDAYLSVDDGVNLYAISSVLGIYLATANQILPVHLSAGINVPTNLAGLRKGVCNFSLLVQNNTAGTLTIPGGGGNIPMLHGFVTGDSSN